MGKMWIWIGASVFAVMLGAVLLVSLASRHSMGRIEGRVWVTSAKGESFDQRDQLVYLLRTTVTSRQIRQASQGTLDEIKRRAAQASEGSGIIDDASALEAKISAVQGGIPIENAIGMVNAPPFRKYGTVGFDDFATAAVRTTTTNTEGHYEFRGVPSGRYILLTRTSAGVITETATVNEGGTVVMNLH